MFFFGHFALAFALLCATTRTAHTGASPSWNSTPDQASVTTSVSGAASGDTVHVASYEIGSEKKAPFERR